MENILQDELRTGEKLLWSAQPEAFETLDVTHKQPFFKKLIIICGVALILSVLYIVFALNKGIDIKPALLAILLGGSLVACLNSLGDGKKLRNTTYAITDKRLIRISDRARSVEYACINEAQFKTDKDGHVSLLCGKVAIKSKPNLWRMFSISDAHINQETGICEAFAFYAVPDADRVRKILSDYLPL